MGQELNIFLSSIVACISFVQLLFLSSDGPSSLCYFDCMFGHHCYVTCTEKSHVDCMKYFCIWTSDQETQATKHIVERDADVRRMWEGSVHLAKEKKEYQHLTSLVWENSQRNFTVAFHCTKKKLCSSLLSSSSEACFWSFLIFPTVSSQVVTE